MAMGLSAVNSAVHSAANTISMGTEAAAGAAAKFARGQEGNPDFAVRSLAEVIESMKGMPEGYKAAAGFIEMPNGDVIHGVVNVTPRYETSGGLFGIGAKTRLVGYDSKVIQSRAEPAIPAPPPLTQRVSEQIARHMKEAVDLGKEAMQLGADKELLFGRAKEANQTADKLVDTAYELYKTGDQIGARSAVSQAVSHTVSARKWEQRAEQLAGKQKQLSEKVNTFKAGLEALKTDVDLLTTDLSIAQKVNNVTVNMTNVGGNTEGLAADIESIREQIRLLDASTANLDNQVASGEASNLIYDPLRAAGEAAERRTAEESIMARLEARFAQEGAATATNSDSAVIGAANTQAAAATDTQKLTMG